MKLAIGIIDFLIWLIAVAVFHPDWGDAAWALGGMLGTSVYLGLIEGVEKSR